MAGSTSTANQSASPAAAATTSGQDELYQALHSRLVTTGEWQRLSTLLSSLLLHAPSSSTNNNSSFHTDLSRFAESKVQEMDTLNLDELVKVVTQKGLDSIPPKVHAEMLAQIKDFLDRNVEEEEDDE